MGLVLFALKYRVTFYVLAVFILLAGGGSAVVMRKDVLPEVNIPVVNVLWTYTGLDAPDMQNYVTSYEELAISNNVVGIRRMASTTLQGITLTKIYFYQDTDINFALSQVIAATNAIRAQLPVGIQPPIVLRFDASSVPVIQLAATSTSESQAQVYDYTRFQIRPVLQTTHGATIPPPFGGQPENAQIDLDVNRLDAFSLTPQAVLNAITSQNLILPSGLAKFGPTQFVMKLNSVPSVLSRLNDIPITVRNGQPILVRDVGWARAGGSPQQNIVHVDGRPGVLLSILKNGGTTSTLDITGSVKDAMPGIKASAPKSIKVISLFDQSVFVTGAIGEVVREGLIAAALTGLMILMFLGSWRATLVVLVSIPLAILSSLAVLALMGETINLMTLGGLALAIGILVDDATVAIENTYRLLEEKRPFREAVAHGAAGIAKPALISTLAICSAFVSVLFLTGAAKYIFTPQALAVVFAMLASYLLSRTLVPILVDVLCRHETHGGEEAGEARPKGGRVGRAYAAFRVHFERAFARFQAFYEALLAASLEHRRRTVAVAGTAVAVAACMFVFLGRDYFPVVSGDSLTLHVRARPGLRIEDASRLFERVEDTIRAVVPKRNMGDIVDNIGLPTITYNLAFNDGTFVAYNDGQVLATFKPGSPVQSYVKRLRVLLRQRFPDAVFYFQPSDIITQILDFGTPSQIDVQVTGKHPVQDIKVPAGPEIPDRANPRRRRHPHPADPRRAGLFGHRRPAAGVGAGADDPADRRPGEHRDLGVLPGQPGILDRPEDRRALAALGAGARIPARHAGQGAGPAAEHGGTRRRDQPVQQRGDVQARRGAERADADQLAADLGRLRVGAGHRSGLGGGADRAHRRRRAEAPARARQDHRAGADRKHERCLPAYRVGIGDRGDRGLPADGPQLPELGRSVRGLVRAADGVLGRGVLPVHHRDQLLDPVIDGRDHERGRRECEFDPAGDVRARASRGDGRVLAGGGDHGRQDAAASGADDGRCDVRGADPDGALTRRRLRGERGAGAGGHGRDRVRNLFDAAVRAVPLHRAEVRAGSRAGGLHMSEDEKGRPPAGRLPARRLAVGVGVPIAVLIAIGVVGRIETDRAADETVRQSEMAPEVQVATARRDDAPVTVSLPAQTASFDNASLYPRATGYIAERRVDIGSRVHRGDLLIRISAPDTDAQLAQAQAQVGQMEAALLQAQSTLKSAGDSKKLADITSSRTSTLAREGWSPVQSADNDRTTKLVSHASVRTAQAGIAVAEANLHAQEASVQRLQALVDFERVVAPFDGVITTRNTDIGDLVQADGNGGGTPLFTEASDDVLRTEVYVPQSEAVGITDGIPASVTVPEMPGRVFKATVSRSAVAVAADSRSMLTEIDIPNPDHLLRPGLFVNITFKVPRPHPVVTVPDASVIFNSDGLQVATVADGHAHMRHITIQRDLGTVAELSDGLQGGEQVIVSPPADLVDGAAVTVPDKGQAHGKRVASVRMPPA